MVGDLNVIDHDTLGLRRPELVNDLPGRARRLVQRADGYVATFKAGESILENAKATGAETRDWGPTVAPARLAGLLRDMHIARSAPEALYPTQ